RTPDEQPGRAGSRHRTVAVSIAAAVALGTAAVGLDAASSGHEVRGGGKPAVTVSPDPDAAAREAAEDLDQPAPDQPPSGGS
ncbi:hypothetical protein, partial [Streptomyces nanshensis]|uniref:hypothetical protein n=1 Tax=Streptomyces nanshensis TaxID=518642 RepID=UPI001C0C9097